MMNVIVLWANGGSAVKVNSLRSELLVPLWFLLMTASLAGGRLLATQMLVYIIRILQKFINRGFSFVITSLLLCFLRLMVGVNVARVTPFCMGWMHCSMADAFYNIVKWMRLLVSRLSWCGRCLSSPAVLQFEKEERWVKAKDLLRM